MFTYNFFIKLKYNLETDIMFEMFLRRRWTVGIECEVIIFNNFS